MSSSLAARTTLDSFSGFKNLGLYSEERLKQAFSYQDELELHDLAFMILMEFEIAQKWFRRYRDFTAKEFLSCRKIPFTSYRLLQSAQMQLVAGNPSFLQPLFDALMITPPLFDRFPSPPINVIDSISGTNLQTGSASLLSDTACKSFWSGLYESDRVNVLEFLDAQVVWSGIDKLVRQREVQVYQLTHDDSLWGEHDASVRQRLVSDLEAVKKDLKSVRESLVDVVEAFSPLSE